MTAHPIQLEKYKIIGYIMELQALEVESNRKILVRDGVVYRFVEHYADNNARIKYGIWEKRDKSDQQVR